MRSEFIDVAGIRTHYLVAGSGPAVLLVHGGSFGTYYNAFHWKPVIDRLCERYHVYAVDKLGQGHTDNPKRDDEYTMTAVIDHLNGFVDTVSLAQVCVVGHSRGALPAAYLAINRPGLVDSLVVVSSNTLPRDDPSTPADFYTRLDENAPESPDKQFVTREPRANSFSHDHIDVAFVDRMLAIAKLDKTIHARQAMSRLRNEVFLPDVLRCRQSVLNDLAEGKLSVPALLLWGMNDVSARVGLGYSLLTEFAMSTPDVEMHVFNQAAHYVYREQADAFCGVLSEFLERHHRSS